VTLFASGDSRTRGNLHPVWPRALASAGPAADPAAEARRILQRLEFHYTPKRASWLNMVEIEIGVVRGQCLDRRIDDPNNRITEIAGRNNGTPPAPKSNGCSQPKRPAPKWAAPIPSRAKSHSHCAD